MPLSQIVSASIEDGAVAPVDLSSVAQYTGFKNRIINGGMRIDQRNAGASVTQTTGALYSVDRFGITGTVTSKFTAQQNAGSVTPPAGFTNYLGITSSSAYSVLTGDLFVCYQRIEGFNAADLAWGTASAATVTLSFWVRSSLTGTFGGSLKNSADNRSYPFTYTISAANTWEQKSVTIAGDTSGTWLTNNGVGIQLSFSLGVGATYSGTAGSWAGTNYLSATGATSVVGTSGATLYITGVQLEKGVTATSFDYRPYTTELQLCQRYLPAYICGSTASPFATGYARTSAIVELFYPFQVQARVPPTGITLINAASTFRVYPVSITQACSSVTFSATFDASTFVGAVNFNTAGSPAMTVGQFVIGYASNATSAILFTGCEL